MSNVTELGTQVAWYGMFLDCKNLEEINLSNWDISNVARMGSMFTNCSALKEPNLNDFKTNNVTDMGELFNGCTNLEKLMIRNFDMSKVTNSFKFMNMVPITIKIETNKATYEWFKEKCPNYLNCIYIVKSDDNKLN